MTSASTVNLPVTYLFVPGNRPDRFGKALASSADVIIVDLEDAVAPGDKDAARTAFADWCRASAPARERIAVRINAEDTPWFADDLRVVAETGVRSVVLPKAEKAAQITHAASALRPDGFVIALVETAKGVIGVDELATAPRLNRIAFGTLDYALDLDITGDERGLIYPACRIALASRAVGVAPPIAGVTPEIGDETRLRADLDLARACGFGAKLCIHPKQVEVVHAAMRPSASEIAWAERVVVAAERGGGAVQVDGKMVDRPVLAKAERILKRT